MIDMVNDANTAFQSVIYWPRNCCAPKVTVAVSALGAKISGHHKSFQIGIIENIPIAPSAGRIRGNIIQ